MCQAFILSERLCPYSVGGCGHAESDIVFILDSSTSVTAPNFAKMLDFIAHFVSAANINDGSVRIGAVLYSTDVKIQFHLNEYRTKQEIIDAIKKIPYVYGSTNTYGGLNIMRTQMFTRQNGDRPSVPNIAILLTDGVSNINAFDTVPEAEKARADNIHIYAVGIGIADTTELSQICSPPISDNMFVVDDFQALSVLKDTILNQFCPGSYMHDYRYFPDMSLFFFFLFLKSLSLNLAVIISSSNLLYLTIFSLTLSLVILFFYLSQSLTIHLTKRFL